MNIKNTGRILLAATVIFSLTFAGCGKYDDGPAFSLRTKKARLTGEWEVVEYDGKKLDEDETWTVEFKRDGEFEMTSEYYDIEYDCGYDSYYNYNCEEIRVKEKVTLDGEWTWEDGKKKIELDYDDSDMGKEEFEILKLTNKEMTLETEDGEEIEFEKK